MRVKLSLQAVSHRPTLPLNCNHAVAGLIYRTLSQASEEFATRLQED
jgi:CRISPR/Cas system endoribonuclease Cas6 (RAMP superfamily)